ncbi:MAG: glycosyltransferase family 2 protein, partial [Prevotella sp.]|nr:glycosyltransferase family 2 protein [Prevotella sp.]
MQIKQNSPLVDETEKISFIITYYNIDVDMLCQCIDSIMALSLRPSEREIIVIDDGSDVSPIEALRKYDNDIMYVRQSNQGLSAARNAGIRISTGMYIQFMDADDYLIQPAFEHCLDIVRYNNPDIVLFQLTDKESKEVTVEFEGPVDGSEYMRQHNLRASACGYIFRKATLVNLR